VIGEKEQVASRRRLVEMLDSSRYLSSDAVRRAFLAVPRELFVPSRLRSNSYVDTPLPIGHGQTISAPSMIAIMLEELELSTGQKVLEIGAGSGYNAALLREIVGTKVFTIERIPELVEQSRANLDSAGYAGKVEVVLGDGTRGYEEEMPYDRILVTAGSPGIPDPLVAQLATGGILGIPVGRHRAFQDFLTVRKLADGTTESRSHGGCVFVPLIGEHGW
jgi:protein-L-isoaspartate(D-aspartate) O-methyltransferase